MAETISSISVRLDADTAEYIRALKDAQRDTQKRLAKIQKEFSATQKAIKRSANVINVAIGGIATGLSVNIFAGIISDTTELVAEQQRLAAQLNITTDELRSYEYVGKFLGKSGDQMADVFKEVNERFEDAARGAGEARDILSELNLSVDDFIGLKPDEQYAKLATELDKLDFNTAAYWADKFGDQLYETYLVQRNLGVNVAELRKEYDELFGLDSTGLDDRMKEAQRSLIQIDEIWSRFKISFTAALAPVLTDLLEQAVEYLKQLGNGNISVGIINATNQFISGLNNIVNGFIDGAEFLYNAFVRVYNSLPASIRTPDTSEQQGQLSELGKREIELAKIIQAGTSETTTYVGGALQTVTELTPKAKKAKEELTALKEEAAQLKLEIDNVEPRLLEEISLANVDFQPIEIPITPVVTVGGESTGEQPSSGLPSDFGQTDTIFNSQYAQLDEQYNQQLELQRAYLENKLITQQEFDQQERDLQTEHAKAVIQKEQETANSRADAWKLSQEQIQNVLSQAGNTLFSYAQSLAGASDEEKKELKKRFLQNQAFAVAQAGINYFAQLASIYLTAAELGITGPFWEATEVVRATANYAATTAGIVGTALVGGAFHGGVDEVPASLNNKSFLLKEGERVVQPEANKDLTQFLSNPQQRSQPSSVTINAPVNVSGNVTDEAWFSNQLMKQRNTIYAAQKKSERENPTKRRR